MNWIIDTLSSQTDIQAIIIISAVSALGIALGKVKIFGVSLGITMVFFAGILAGHFGLLINQNMLYFAEDFGLLLYIYSLGLQVGPGFIASLGKSSLVQNGLSVLIILFGTIIVLVMQTTGPFMLNDLMGMFAGAVTNTPLLAAAQQTLSQMNLPMGNMAIGVAVAYPMGVIGVILVLILLQKIDAITNINQIKSHKEDTPNYSVSFEIINPELHGISIKELAKKSEWPFIVSLVWREGKVFVPMASTELWKHDHLLLISRKSYNHKLAKFFDSTPQFNWDHSDIDWNDTNYTWNMLDSKLESSRVVVTQQRMNGRRLKSLRFRNIYGVNITKILRGDIELLARPDLTLQIGDRVTIVGQKKHLQKVEDILGNKVQNLDTPNMITFFVGLVLGLLIGEIPFHFPGIAVPIKLGLAGGPIIAGILVSTVGARIRMIAYTTVSTSRMLKTMGLALFLACLGINSGARFFEVVMSSNGLMMLAFGTLITVVPALIIGLFDLLVLKNSLESVAGVICGSMANPMALDYFNDNVGNEKSTISYASVFPLTLFLRIILTQVTIMLFW